MTRKARVVVHLNVEGEGDHELPLEMVAFLLGPVSTLGGVWLWILHRIGMVRGGCAGDVGHAGRRHGGRFPHACDKLDTFVSVTSWTSGDMSPVHARDKSDVTVSAKAITNYSGRRCQSSLK